MPWSRKKNEGFADTGQAPRAPARYAAALPEEHRRRGAGGFLAALAALWLFVFFMVAALIR